VDSGKKGRRSAGRGLANTTKTGGRRGRGAATDRASRCCAMGSQEQRRRRRWLRPLGAPHLLAVAVLVLAPAPATAQSGLPPTYPIDWTAVPDAAAAAAAAGARDLDGGCICDLLSGTCTPHCCCDPDCPEGVVAAFRAGAGCLPEGPQQQQLDYCAPAEAFAQVRAAAGAVPLDRPAPRRRPLRAVSVLLVQLSPGCRRTEPPAGLAPRARACAPAGPPAHPQATTLARIDPPPPGQPAERRLLPHRQARRRRGPADAAAVHRWGQQPQPGRRLPWCARAGSEERRGSNSQDQLGQKLYPSSSTRALAKQRGALAQAAANPAHAPTPSPRTRRPRHGRGPRQRSGHGLRGRARRARAEGRLLFWRRPHRGAAPGRRRDGRRAVLGAAAGRHLGVRGGAVGGGVPPTGAPQPQGEAAPLRARAGRTDPTPSCRACCTTTCSGDRAVGPCLL
jgi:hypothetical protein